jgi:hypothetical protein
MSLVPKNIIRSFLSLFLIVLFASSITPKKTLHDLFGCHPETTTTITCNGKQQITTSGFHCSCQQPELQTTFLHQPFIGELQLPKISYPAALSLYNTALFERAILFSKLRGPPSLLA